MGRPITERVDVNTNRRPHRLVIESFVLVLKGERSLREASDLVGNACGAALCR